MHVFEMDEEAHEKWSNATIAFGRKMLEKGIDIIELDGRGIKITPTRHNNLFLEGILFLGFKLYGLERVKIWKYGDPVFLVEVHVTHLDGETVMRIPDEE